MRTRMRLKTAGWAMAAAALLATAACKDEGGELRDATERRRAEMANRDTTGDRASPFDAGADTGTRLQLLRDFAVAAVDQRRPEREPADVRVFQGPRQRGNVGGDPLQRR